MAIIEVSDIDSRKGPTAVSLRVYTLSAISVTVSAVAGLWLGAVIATSHPHVEAGTPAVPAVSGTELSATTPRP